jgi:precorrin-3B C17-methyltransferase
VGIGPGARGHRTLRAVAAITESQAVVGYQAYLRTIADLTGGKQVIASGMTHEVARCRQALRLATAGNVVALISSGDAGVYGMAGLALELAAAESFDVPIEIVPGVTAASAAAAALGAPLMLDYATISLSDLLVPWDTVRRRLEAVAAADLVVALYNPRSTQRIRQFEEALSIFRACRPGDTPVGVATAMGRHNEAVVVTNLERLDPQAVNMQSLVIIGNSTTRVIGGRMLTARGYAL